MDRLIETRHIAAAYQRDVIVAASSQQQEDLSKWLFQLTTTGGAISLPSRVGGQGDTQLLWQLHISNAATLSLAEVSCSTGQIGKGVQLHIEDQVFPAIPSCIFDGSCYLFLLLSSKSIGVLQLRLPGTAAAVEGGRQAARQTVNLSHSILDTVHVRSLQQLQLGQQQLSAVGVPTAFTVADGYLCIAGSSGSVVCLPLQAVLAGSLQGVIQLLQTSVLSHVRRRMGFAVHSSVVAALPVDLPALGHQSLLVLNEDTSCQQWFVAHNRQGFSQTLAADAAARQLRPHQAVLCPVHRRSAERASRTHPPFDAVLVWDMGLPDRSGESDVMVMPFKLQTAAGAASAGPSRLEPLLQQPQLLQLEWQDALLVDAQVVGQQLLLLLCSTRRGGSCVVRYSCKDWSFMGRCQLLQQRAASEWGMKEEIWSAALATCPSAITPASHVLSQLLVPGQLCVSTLVQALDLHGARVSEQEVAASSLQQLQARITGTVELIIARYPSYGSARCWHMFFSSYCDIWQQQHGLQGLFVAPGGWCGLLRAGGLITVLRKASPAEALQQESSAAALGEVLQAVGASGTSSGIPGGAAAVAKVGLCLAAVGEVLGEPALRVLTQLVMAGVNVEGELLPKFVQLLLQGPPAPGLLSHADVAAGSAAYQQQQLQRLAEWRMLRQARLLSVQEQLAELPHVLETLSGVAELVVKVAVAAAGQPQQPTEASTAAAAAADGSANEPPAAIGNLVCSVALHSARASCMALQQVLLLLSCLKHLGSIGSTQLTAADQAAISTDLMPPLAAALRSAAAVLWLCKTPASTVISVGSRRRGGRGITVAAGPLLGLRLPTPSGTPAVTPRGMEGPVLAAAGGMAAPAAAAAAVAAAAPSWHFPLAAHWLASFWTQQEQQELTNAAPGTSLHALGSRLAVWLILGAGADASAAAAAAVDGSSNGAYGADCSRLINASCGSTSNSPAAAAASAAYAAVVSRLGLPGRAVLLGYQLFVFREYEAMKKLVALVGGDSPAEPGLQFILGLSLACGMTPARTAGDAADTAAATSSGSSRGGQDGSALLGCALGHLFRAAAGFCGGDAAPLRLVLQLLRQRQGSSAPAAAAAVVAADAMEVDGQLAHGLGTTVPGDSMTGAAAADEAQVAVNDSRREAVLRLQFCEAVMRLFEREGAIEGALAFARAALGCTEAAFLPHEEQLKLQQQADLWTSVLNFACDLQRHDDAYAAAVANPLPERAAESVKRLVQVLLDQGEISQLLSLPWAGVLSLRRDGVMEAVPVVELVTNKLVRRALHSEISSRPSPYHTLFDFLTAWGSYKAAAASMLSYARRLRTHAASADRLQHVMQRHEGSGVVEEVLAAYDSCLCMLQLLAPEDAWLDSQQPLLVASFAPPSQVFSSSNQPIRRHQQQQDDLPPPVVTLVAVQQEAELFKASALLQQHLPGLEILDPASLTASYVMEQLVGSCLLPEALQFAYTIWSGEQLYQQLEGLVSAVAEACVKLQAQGDAAAQVTGEGHRTAGRLQQSVRSYTGPGYLGSSAAPAWEKLRSLLDMYDDKDNLGGDGGGMPAATAAAAAAARGGVCAAAGHGGSATGLAGRLRLAAVDGLLSVQAGFTLPDWLLQPFKPVHATAGGMAGFSADPAGLLRVFIKHGRLVDAAQLVQDHLEAWQRNSPLLRATAAAVWLPLRDMELLHASLVAGARRAVDAGLKGCESEVLGLWSEVLEAVVGDHMALARSDAAKLSAGVQGDALLTQGY